MVLKSKSKSLTAALVRNAKEPGRYYDNQRTGLFLEVRPNLSRFWLQRIVIHGKRRELGLGSPPFTSLAEAREQAFVNKKAVRDGGDPLASKRERMKRKTFEEAARLAHVELSPTWKNPKDRASFLSSLEKYIFPHFGNRPLAEVTTADVRKAILIARDQAPGVAKKVIYRVSAVFKWGIAEGLCENNPSLAQALPRVEVKTKHRKEHCPMRT